MKKRILSVLLILILSFGYSVRVYATTVDEVREQQEQTQEELDEVNDRMDEIENQREAVEEEIIVLDTQLVDILTSISICEDEIAAKEDEIDVAHILDGYTRDNVFVDEGIYGFKTLQEMAKEHKNAEATPFVLEGTSEDIEPKDTSERLADLYTEVVLVKIHLDEILKQIDELLKQEREKE